MALKTRTREKAQMFQTVHAEAVSVSELIFLLHVNMYVSVNSSAAKRPTGPSFHHTSVGPVPHVQCF